MYNLKYQTDNLLRNIDQIDLYIISTVIKDKLEQWV